MTERPILFSDQMVRAILDNLKTQTRRLIKPQPGSHIDPGRLMACSPMQRAKYTFMGDGKGIEIGVKPMAFPGDRLWVRETWGRATKCDCRTCTDMAPVRYRADWKGEPVVDGWRPSIHMPRWASRITLEVVGIRVERVQDISEDDARAEGFSSREEFWSAWDSMYARKGLGVEANPWEWPIEFKRIEMPGGER